MLGVVPRAGHQGDGSEGQSKSIHLHMHSFQKPRAAKAGRREIAGLCRRTATLRAADPCRQILLHDGRVSPATPARSVVLRGLHGSD
jgi:hypothetical protein